MYKVIAEIEGIGCLQQGAEYESQLSDEDRKLKPRDREEKCWLMKAHTREGQIVIPRGAFKGALVSACKHSGLQIPGKGKSTYAAKFACGMTVIDDPKVFVKVNNKYTPATTDNCEKAWVFGNSKGLRGQTGGMGGRVWKAFPTWREWKCEVIMQVFDTVNLVQVDEKKKPNDEHENIIIEMLSHAGAFIGVCTWRPENGGEYGRWKVNSFQKVEC